MLAKLFVDCRNFTDNLMLWASFIGWLGITQYQSGELTPQTITNWLGFGVGEIRVANLTDGALEVALYEIDEETGGPILCDDFSLESLDMGTIGTILPKSYELRFIFSEASSIGGSCMMEIESGDIFSLLPFLKALRLHWKVMSIQILTSWIS